MEITPVEVETVLSSAHNLNAALKTLLKREGRSGNSVEPFVKGFRTVVARGRDEELRKYVQENYVGREIHFALLASYAFPTLRDSVGEKVIEKYADSFNATFQRNEQGGVKIVDPEKFKAISNEVVVIVKDAITAAQVPCNNFSVHAMLANIFEPDVFAEVLKVLK